MVPKTLIISNIIGEKNWGDIQDNLFTRKTGKPQFPGEDTADPGQEWQNTRIQAQGLRTYRDNIIPSA